MIYLFFCPRLFHIVSGKRNKNGGGYGGEMATKLYHFTSREIAALGQGKHSDGGGLYFYRVPKGTYWVFRYTRAGKRHEIGVGGYPVVSLKAARERAENHRRLLQTGGDPKAAKIAEKSAAKAQAELSSPDAVEIRKLGNVALRAFEARKHTLRDGGRAGRWFSPLRTHVLPKLGQRDIETITVQDVTECLRPIWHEKPDVAHKAITRLGMCLSFARAEGRNVGRNTIADAKEILGKQYRQPQHIPSMPWQDVPVYYASLGVGSVDLALRLLILTGLRSKPVRLAHVDQFNGETWTAPAANMKGQVGKAEDFAIPLSPEALDVIETAKVGAVNGFLFTGPRGKPISDMGMSAKMRRDRLVARPHGFRASFRTWADECTTAAYETKETAIAHKVGGMTERSYARSTFFDLRKTLMDQWSAFVTGRELDAVSET